MLLLILILVALMSGSLFVLLGHTLYQAWLKVSQEYEMKITQTLTEHFILLPIRHLFLCWLVCYLFLLTSAFLWGLNLISLFLLTASWLVMPTWFYRQLKKRRQNRFREQLPDACMLVANTLKVGGTLPSAFLFLANHSHKPLSQEFSVVVRSLRLGHSLNETLNKLKLRMPVEELNRVTHALTLGQETGGQQAVLLEKIAASLRAKAQLTRRIKSLSSQGKLQGKVMSALPFFLGGVLWALEPFAMVQLFEQWVGWALLAVMCLLIGIGQYLIYKVIQIKVPL